jgi:hypothetical protein
MGHLTKWITNGKGLNDTFKFQNHHKNEKFDWNFLQIFFAYA